MRGPREGSVLDDRSEIGARLGRGGCAAVQQTLSGIAHEQAPTPAAAATTPKAASDDRQSDDRGHRSGKGGSGKGSSGKVSGGHGSDD